MTTLDAVNVKNVYCVACDLNDPDKDRKKLIRELAKSYACWPFQEHVWLVYTSESVRQLWRRISPHVDRDEIIVITQFRAHSRQWLFVKEMKADDVGENELSAHLP